MPPEHIEALHREAKELTAIITASRKSAANNPRS
jgi:hypothetical protein